MAKAKPIPLAPPVINIVFPPSFIFWILSTAVQGVKAFDTPYPQQTARALTPLTPIAYDPGPMSLKRTPELHQFLTTYFADADPDADEQTVRAFIAAADSERLRLVVTQAQHWLAAPELPVEELGMEANRWFGDAQEARAWFGKILTLLQGAQATTDAAALIVKDSNGTPLSEGDSVQVIKDLKVKGGSSDLKRGTLIKKIHLIDDPENIECRVDGSTLVLKTCFLKKA